MTPGVNAASLYITPRARPGGRAAGAVAPAVCLALLAACGAPRAVRPNVLLVVISGLRADHVSAYGYRRPTTPAIDSLAASGSLFEQAIATAPWDLTSQASILTGLYPSEHGAVFAHPALDPSLETLPERLKAAGYATFAVSTDSVIGQGNGFFQGIDHPVELHPEREGSPDEGAAEAETAFTDWLSSRNGPEADAPFFAYVVLTNPQIPFNPPGEYRQKFLDRPIPLPRLEQISQFWFPFARQLNLGLQTLSPDDQAALVALYDGEVAYADYRVGRLVESLRVAKRLDDTLVVVTADAGEDLTDHGLLAESTRLYDSMVRVPLVMCLPGRVPAGRRVAEQVQTHDIFSTVLALTAAAEQGAGARRGATTGAGEAPLMTPRAVAISESRFDPAALRYYRSVEPAGDLRLFENNMLAVRTPEFKYIVTSDQRAALFDLKADPVERSTVLTARMDKARELADRIRVWQAALKTPPLPAAPPQAAGPAARPPAPDAAKGPAR